MSRSSEGKLNGRILVSSALQQRENLNRGSMTITNVTLQYSSDDELWPPKADIPDIFLSFVDDLYCI